MTMPIGEGIIWEIPACVRSAMHRCLEDDPSKRPDMRAILEDDERLQVLDTRKQHMCWQAEYRLRRSSWYAYRVTFRGGVDPAFQWLMQLLRAQILARGRGEENAAADEWDCHAE